MNRTKITALSLFFIIFLTSIYVYPLRTLAQSPNVYLALDNPIALSGDERIPVDPVNPTAAPFMDENQTVFVPLGFAAKTFGYTVNWNKGSKIITFSKDTSIGTMEIDSTLFTVDQKKIKLSSPPILYGNIVYIPLRPLAEDFLQKQLSWDNGGYVAISDTAQVFEKDPTLLPTITRKLNALQPIGTKENFDKMVKANNVSNGSIMTDMFLRGAKAAAIEESNSSTSMDTGSNYATTNIQVASVDEADIVKTDGKYIYFLNNNQLTIVDAQNPKQMLLSTTLDFSTELNPNFNPIDLYLDQNTLTIIGNQFAQPTFTENSDMRLNADTYYNSSREVAAYVYDITQLPTLALKRTFAIEGTYHSSRKIGDVVYLLTQHYIYNKNSVYQLPSYKDNQQPSIPIGFGDIYMFPNAFSFTVTSISSISIDDIEQPAQTRSYLTGAETSYVSNNALYFTLTDYRYINPIKPDMMILSTNIYKFTLDNGNIQFGAKGKVPGMVLNQFSIDEYKNDLRIATTDNNNTETSNNLFILDAQLKLKSKLTDLAKGERIYSTRFLGDQIYMVTFKQVDPLFVIDAKNPNQPKILGELKIPGYSTYLHPLDDTHLIGFGKDTRTEIRDDREILIDNGLKMSLFDITDFSQPKELFTETIGESGSYSELLYNHKALMFDPVRGLFGFPADVNINTKQTINGQPYYGTLHFNGAFVYHVDIKNGFKLMTQISHSDDGEDYNNSVKRVVYIGDTIYTLSDRQIIATDLKSGKAIDQIVFK